MTAPNKSHRMLIRFTPQQVEKIQALAEQDGERPSTWVRQAVLREVRERERERAQ